MKIYRLLITTFFFSLVSCINDNQCITNNNLSISFVTDIENHNIQNGSSKSKFSEEDIIGIYMIDYKGNMPISIGSISNFMNIEYIYNGNNWISKNGEELYLRTEQTKANLYAYYPFDYEMSRTSDKLNVRSYPFSVKNDQNLNPQKNDFLWAKYSSLSSSNTIAQLTFKHILSKVVINLRFENLGNGTEPVTIHNLRNDALIDLESGDVSVTGINADSQIIPYTQDIANSGFDKTLNAIIIPQSVSSGVSIFSININNELYAFVIEDRITFQSGFAYTFNLIIGEANTRNTRSKSTHTKKKISLVDITPF